MKKLALTTGAVAFAAALGLGALASGPVAA